MRTYLITYDLMWAGQNYTHLHEAIKMLSGGTWWHNLESVWLIRHPGSAISICNQLAPAVDHNDKLLVVAVDADWASYHLPDAANDWLRNTVAA